MFPESFAEEHIERWSKAGDLVFDPFSGRGTTPLQALLMDRRAIAMDINPVAYCITAAKCNPPSLLTVLRRIDALEAFASEIDHVEIANERRSLPGFFGRAFHWRTLDEILGLRRTWEWRTNAVDTFVAALALGILHGEMRRSSRYLSNQMPRTISTKPEYSLRYWRKNGLWALRKKVFPLLRSEARFRLSGSVPRRGATVALGDSRKSRHVLRGFRRSVSLIVTSPPYFDVTRFEEDQWLRLWLLGFPPKPQYRSLGPDDRHSSKDPYWRFLAECFAGSAPLLADRASIVIRIGSGRLTDEELRVGLMQTLDLPGRHLELIEGPTKSPMRRRQTSAFRPGSIGMAHEVDFVFRTSRREGKSQSPPGEES
jgi:hypothetical protein